MSKLRLQELLAENEMLCYRMDYLICRWEEQGHAGDAKEIAELSNQIKAIATFMTAKIENQSSEEAA